MRIKGINQNMVLSNVCLAEILINKALPTTQRHAQHAPQKSSLKRFVAWLGAEAIATLKWFCRHVGVTKECFQSRFFAAPPMSYRRDETQYKQNQECWPRAEARKHQVQSLNFSGAN
jgi:hypothetical protein